jgi:hypothetical protein
LVWSRSYVISKFDELVNNHPNEVSKEDVGVTTLGAKVPLYRIGTNPQTKVLLDGCIHGYETEPAQALYNLSKWLLEADDPAAKSALRRLQVIIVPIVNYDEYAIQRKNANGVDLNRNFVSGWCGGSSDPSSEYYKGPSPASEKETQFMRALFQAEKPKVYVNFHGTGGDPSTLGDIRRIAYAGATYENKCIEILNKTLSICEARGVSKPGTMNSYTSPEGYAVHDCYALTGAYAFLWEVWYGSCTDEQINTTITYRMECFIIAVDQLYGLEPPAQPGAVVAAQWLESLIALAAVMPLIYALVSKVKEAKS